MLKQPKDRRVAALLALAGAVSPISGWHKFYLGQPGWGCLYLTLSLVNPWNPIPRIASMIEAVWYLFQNGEGFEPGLSLPLGAIAAGSLASIPSASKPPAFGDTLRELDRLRQEGLISEAEFEQKRRQLLNARSAPPKQRIDVNQAGLDDWLRLPGLSIHQARSLVTLTQSGVSFHCLEDLAAALSLPLQQLRPLEPLLQFCYYDPDRPDAISRLNVNTASLEDLLRLPPIDSALSEAIIQQRQAQPYRDLTDFQQRLQLSASRTADLMHYLYFSDLPTVR